MKKWHYIVIAILGALAGALAHRAHGGVPVKFTVETSRADIQEIPCYHGETLDFEVTMKNYGQNLNLPTNEPAQIFWQTNGMSAFYWRTNNVNIVSNKYFATFTPEMDPGTTTCFGFIGTPKEIYRASFVLRFKNSPGTEPKVMEWPYRELDFNKIEVLNAPWYAQAVVDAKDQEIMIAASNAVPVWVDARLTNTTAKAIGRNNTGGGFAVGQRNDTGAEAPHIGGMAMGEGNGIAVGYDNRAEKIGSLAVGMYAKAEAIGTTAIGYFAEADAVRDVAIGSNANASGYESVALGVESETKGSYSVALPYSKTTAAAQYSMAGGGATAGGEGAFAFGRSAEASGAGSIAIGSNTVASADGVVAIGKNVHAIEGSEVGIGQNVYAGVEGVAIGNCVTGTEQSVVIGGQNYAWWGASAIGYRAEARGVLSEALGGKVKGGDLSVAIGASAYVTNGNAVVITGENENYSTGNVWGSHGDHSITLGVYGSDAEKVYIGDSNLVQIINANAPTPTPESIGAYSASDGTNLSQRVNSVSNMVANIRIEERYDFADFANMVEALSNIVVRLGGEAYNFPTNINKGIELKKDASGKYYIETED